MPWFFPSSAEMINGANAYGNSSPPMLRSNVPLPMSTINPFMTVRCPSSVPNINTSRELLANVSGWLIQSCASAVKNTSNPNKNCLACWEPASAAGRPVP